MLSVKLMTGPGVEMQMCLIAIVQQNHVFAKETSLLVKLSGGSQEDSRRLLLPLPGMSEF